MGRHQAGGTVTEKTGRPIEVVSVSLYEGLKRCPLRVAFDRRETSNPVGQRPVHPNAALGLLVHRAFEITFKEEIDLGTAWREALSEPAFLKFNFETMPAYRRTRLRAERRHEQMLSLVKEYSGSETIPEVQLRSNDGIIEGRVDLLVTGPSPFIVDYKTGLVQDDDGRLHGPVQRQLQVYSALVAQQQGLQIDFGFVVSMKSDPIRVDFIQEEVDAIIADMVAEMKSFNEHLETGQVGRPEPDWCRWCRHIHRCGTIKDAVRLSPGTSFGDLDIVWGKVTDGPRHANGHVASLEVEVAEGTCAGSFLLFDIPSKVVSNVTVGHHIVVSGMAQARGGNVRRWVNGVTQLHCE
jgi:RecB family exonuclease